MLVENRELYTPTCIQRPLVGISQRCLQLEKNYNERATTVEESMMIMLAISIQYRSVTDERKDGRTELLYQLSRIAVLTRDKISAVQGTTDIPPWSLHSLVFTQRKSDHWRGIVTAKKERFRQIE